MPVSYEKLMRQRAISEQKGLFTIECINANKKPGKFGSRMTMQGPADEEDYKAVLEFMLQLTKRRSDRFAALKAVKP